MRRMKTDGAMESWKDLHAGATVVDMHAHPSLKVSLFRRSLARAVGSSRFLWPPSLRTSLSQLHAGGVDVVLSAAYAPEHGLREEWWPLYLLRVFMPLRWNRYYCGPYLKITLRMMEELEEQIEKHGSNGTLACVAHSRSELDEALAREPRPIVFVHCAEGAHCLDGDVDNLDILADRGLAYLTLAHFYDNGFAPPCYPFDQKLNCPGGFDDRRDLTRSLSTKGERLVAKAHERRVLIDIAHCTPVARRRVLELLAPDQPVLASHIGVKALHPCPYNLSDDEIRTIADRGGVVSVIFMNAWLVPWETSHGLDAIVATLRHVINVGGEQCAALGTDFDGFTDPPDDVKDAAQLPELTSRLVAEGFTSEGIEKLLGGNALALLRSYW